MNTPRVNTGRGPEHAIQQAIIKFLKIRDWTVMPTHGNMYQQGFPDLYCLHRTHGQRWIEVKNKTKYSFTVAQREYFPKIQLSGGGVWIMTEASESEYALLFKKPNWFLYLYTL